MNKFILITLIVLPWMAVAGEPPVEFKKAKIKVGNQLLSVELAENPTQQARGLMYRQSISDKDGMLFIYPEEDIRRFWMKNTFIPLSIGFFDSQRTLVDIQDMSPVKSEMQTDIPTYVSAKKAKYALEVKQGWFKRHNVKIKTRFDFITPKK